MPEMKALDDAIGMLAKSLTSYDEASNEAKTLQEKLSEEAAALEGRNSNNLNKGKGDENLSAHERDTRVIDPDVYETETGDTLVDFTPIGEMLHKSITEMKAMQEKQGKALALLLTAQAGIQEELTKSVRGGGKTPAIAALASMGIIESSDSSQVEPQETTGDMRCLQDGSGSPRLPLGPEIMKSFTMAGGGDNWGDEDHHQFKMTGMYRKDSPMAAFVDQK